VPSRLDPARPAGRSRRACPRQFLRRVSHQFLPVGRCAGKRRCSQRHVLQYQLAGVINFQSSGRVGIGTASPTQALTVAGNINFAGSGTTLTNAGTETIIEETGDAFGTVRLRLRNRIGSAGAIFENPSLDLVDIGFLPNSAVQSNFRWEHRSVYTDAFNPNGEFQFLSVASATPWLISSGVNATILQAASGNVILSLLHKTMARWYFGLDFSDSDKLKFANTTAVPSFSTDTKLTIDTSGKVGIGTTAPGSLLDSGTGTRWRGQRPETGQHQHGGGGQHPEDA
jgi:hypothetical protein